MPPPTGRFRTLGRSNRLFRSFLHEQDDPQRFYGDLAADTITLVEQFQPLDGQTILDVGAGPVEFAEALASAGARYIGLDVDAHTVNHTDLTVAVIGQGERLPFADGSVDLVMSSNVMEHVPAPGVLGREMLRVVRPGGLVVISYTAWLSPWGGHETSPWHLLGGDFAARRYEARQGHPPKNRFGSTMYAARVGQGMRWARRQGDAEVLALVPRYLPAWMDWVVAVPGLREVATWNILMVLRRRR